MRVHQQHAYLRYVHIDVEVCIADVREAVDRQDLKKIGEVAHGLKGICLNLGVTGLAEHCRQIEHQAKNGAAENMNEEITRIQDEFALATSILHDNFLS